jgi:hypothetical protein
MTYAGSALAAIPSDFGAVFDHTLTSPRRAQAAASFAIKVTIVAVLGYAAWAEWQQHIIYATRIAEAEARIKEGQNAGISLPPSRPQPSLTLPTIITTEASPDMTEAELEQKKRSDEYHTLTLLCKKGSPKSCEEGKLLEAMLPTREQNLRRPILKFRIDAKTATAADVREYVQMLCKGNHDESDCQVRYLNKYRESRL